MRLFYCYNQHCTLLLIHPSVLRVFLYTSLFYFNSQMTSLRSLQRTIFRPLPSSSHSTTQSTSNTQHSNILHPTSKSVHHILSRPIDTLLSRMQSHYSLPSIDQWPTISNSSSTDASSTDMQWTYWKQHDIRMKLLALKARGKGPLAKDKAQRKRKK